MRFRSFLRLRAVFAAISLFSLTACGTKPDGTPYGVDPAKTEEGRRKTAAADPDSTRRPHDAIGMPKGAEVNAVTNSARAGTPLVGQPR